MGDLPLLALHFPSGFGDSLWLPPSPEKKDRRRGKCPFSLPTLKGTCSLVNGGDRGTFLHPSSTCGLLMARGRGDWDLRGGWSRPLSTQA